MKRCPVCGTGYPDDTKFCPTDGQTLRAAAPAADLVGQVVADRYDVLAGDVANVVGFQRGLATGTQIPQTRAEADAQTQLLEPPAKKRSLAPVAIGAAVLLAAGGAGVALLGGKNEPTGGDAGVDTNTPSRDVERTISGQP